MSSGVCFSDRQLERWTISDVISYQSNVNQNKVAVKFIEGDSYTYGDLKQFAMNIASGLRSRSEGNKGHVGVLLKNSIEFIQTWLGASWAGYVFVPLNTKLIGQFLTHTLNHSEIEILICDAEQLPEIITISSKLVSLRQVYVVGSLSKEFKQDLPFQVFSFATLQAESANVEPVLSRFDDVACLMFTSGTTGPSKAVMMPNAHCFMYAKGIVENLRVTSQSIYYVTMPLFHANGLFMQVYASFVAGATCVVRSKFSASNWFKDIVNFGVSHTNLLGAMVDFVCKNLKEMSGKDSCLKVVSAAPAPARYVKELKSVLNIEIIELYGMSEVNIPLFEPVGKTRKGSCGKPYKKYFDVRIADSDNDIELPIGSTGEIQVRPKLAGCFMAGYYNEPHKTVSAWKNLWFHTGDAGYKDADGYFYFVDRIKDCIRRRGENISSVELESVLTQYPLIMECAVLSYPSEIEGGEDEILAVIISDEKVDFLELFKFCQQHVPEFAWPRYFMQVDALPKTATEKVKKDQIRSFTKNIDLWDINENI